MQRDRQRFGEGLRRNREPVPKWVARAVILLAIFLLLRKSRLRIGLNSNIERK